jgi:hypothetical protein
MQEHLDPKRLLTFAKLDSDLTNVEAQHLQSCSGCLERYIDFKRQIIRDALPVGTQIMSRPAPNSIALTIQRKTA